MSPMRGWPVVLAGMTLVVAVLALACGGSSDDAGDRYEVTVRFNTSVVQEDIDAVEATLRAYDPALDFVVMESFPPVGRAILAPGSAGFCAQVEGQLEGESYVDGVSCGPWQAPDGGDPDAPVTHENEPAVE